MTRFDFENPVVRSRVVMENESAIAFLTHMPITPGHMLVCPKRAVTLSQDLTAQEWSDILTLKNEVTELLKDSLNAEGFNFAWNEGAVAGQTVEHFHLHVVPRKVEDAGIVKYEPREFLYRPGSRAKSPQEDLEELAELLKQFFLATT